MAKRLVSSCVILVAVQFAFVSAGWAQGTMSFGEDEVNQQEDAASSEKSGPYADYLAEGKKLYKKKKYAEASLLFYKIIQADDVAAEPSVPEAQYELGKTLLRMQLYEGALNYFGAIADTGESHPYFLPALRGLVLLTDVIPGDPSLMQRLVPYASRYPQDVPEKYRDPYAYLVGRYFQQQMQGDQALKLLLSVSKRSEYYGRANYIAAVTHVGNYEAKPAVKTFKKLLRYLQAKDANGGLTDAQQDLLELTTLGMARVFYSTGDYQTSMKYYSKIDRESSRWPQALFESSWAYFQTDDYNKALGNLHSLNSPFFADAYFPEGPILSAVIFFYNCKYKRARRALEDFDYYYAPLEDDVHAVMVDYKDPTAMFEWLQKLEAGQVDFDPQVYQILNAALDDAQVQRKFGLVDTIQTEKKKIASMPSAWKSSPLGSSLTLAAERALSFATNDAGSLARQRLGRVVDELSHLETQREEIQVEVAKAEQGEIKADIRAGMNVKSNVTAAPDIDVGDEQMYWTFDGEYWKDELGAYVFNINSQCSR